MRSGSWKRRPRSAIVVLMPAPPALNLQMPFDRLLRERLPDPGVMDVAADDVLYGPCEASDLFLVEEGLFLVSRGENGRETAIDVLAAGETLPDSVLAGAARGEERARALTPGKVRRWRGAEVAALLARDGEAALAATRMLVRRAARLRQRIAACGAEPVPRRLARVLLYLRGKTGPKLPLLGLQAMGTLAGAAHTLAAVHLDHFVRRGLVTATPSGLIVNPSLEEWLQAS